MPKFDMIFCDIDGTLLQHDHFTVTERNRNALRAAQAQGIKIAVATGRCLHILPAQVDAIGFDYAITCNGAAIQDYATNRKLYHNGFSPEEAELAYRILRQEVDFVEFFINGHILLTQEDYARRNDRKLPIWHTLYFSQYQSPIVESARAFFDAGVPGLEKITLVDMTPDVVDRLWKQLDATGHFSVNSSVRKNMEITRSDCNKGVAIRVLCAHLGLDPARCIAFGDGGNDLDMLSTVGYGVAMGNGKDTAKASAAYVTDDFEADGVAQFIEKYVL